MLFSPCIWLLQSDEGGTDSLRELTLASAVILDVDFCVLRDIAESFSLSLGVTNLGQIVEIELLSDGIKVLVVLPMLGALIISEVSIPLNPGRVSVPSMSKI